MKTGFIIGDYAAIPYGKTKLVIIYKGQQVAEFNTRKDAMAFIEADGAVNLETATKKKTKTTSHVRVQPVREKTKKINKK